MATSRYARHEEGEGSPFAGSLFLWGFEFPYPRMAWIYQALAGFRAHAWRGSTG